MLKITKFILFSIVLCFINVHSMDRKREPFPFGIGKKKCESLLWRCSRAVLNGCFNEDPDYITENFGKLPVEMRDYLAKAVSRPVRKTLETPLHAARSSLLVKQLLVAGADYSRKTIQGYTPLLYHIKKGQREEALPLIEVLPLRILNYKDDSGKTALDFAYDLQDEELIEALKNKGGIQGTTLKKEEKNTVARSIEALVEKVTSRKENTGKKQSESTLRDNRTKAAFKNFMAIEDLTKSVNEFYKLSETEQEEVRALAHKPSTATGLTPLHLAQSGQDVKKILFLAGNKECLGQKTIYNESPLHTMLQLSNFSAALEFMEHATVRDYDYKDTYFMTPLNYAVKSGSLKLVKALIKKGVDLPYCTFFGDGSPLTAFHFLVKHKEHYDLIDYMMARMPNMTKWSVRLDLMCLAIEADNYYLLNKLLPLGCTLDTYNGEQNLLCYAITNSRPLVIRKLLNGKVKMAIKKPSEDSKEKQKCEIVESDVKIDVSLQNTDNVTPLMVAAAERDSWYALHLLNADASIMEDTDNDNNTALFYAVNNGNSGAVKLLVEKGANINHQNNEGLTPLHCAAINNDKDIARLLLENGADFTRTDNKNKKPQDYASDHGDKELFCEILSYEKNWLRFMTSYVRGVIK